MTSLHETLTKQLECQLLERLLPAIEFLGTQFKSAAVWDDGPGENPCTGMQQLAVYIKTVLKMKTGTRKIFAVRVLAIMLYALFPGLWSTRSQWWEHAKAVEKAIVGEITKTSAKRSAVTRTTVDPLTFATQWPNPSRCANKL